MRALIAPFILLASQVAAADIAARATVGRSAMASPEAGTYIAGVMGSTMPQAMKTCAPPDANATTPDWQLTLVGDVTSKGAIRNIEVEPANAITACLAKQFGKTRLPAPPAGSLRNKSFPLLVEVKMTSRVKTQPRNAVVAMPVFSQIVAYSHPDSFTSVFENSFASTYLQESVLQGESIAQWSQMITLTGARDEAKDAASTPRDFVGKIATRFNQACPGTFSSQVAGTTQVAGQDAFVAVLGCGTVQSGTPRSEVTLIVAIKGKSDMYTVQWAERSVPMRQAPVLDGVKWGQRFQQLSPIRLCDRVSGESAPYPSCIGGPVSQ